MSTSGYLRAGGGEDGDSERKALSKLKREHRAERKGAIRELRKDARFLAGVVQKEEREAAREYEMRMRKVHAGMESERAEEKQAEREKQREKKRRK